MAVYMYIHTLCGLKNIMCGPIHYFIFLYVIVEYAQINLSAPTVDEKSANLEISAISQRVRDDKNFVVDRGWQGDLFTVSDLDNPMNTERYMLYDDYSAKGLEMNLLTGMVRRTAGHQWNSTGEEVLLRVNVTRTDDGMFQQHQLVHIYLVERSYTALLFSEVPVPIRVTIPAWNLPWTSTVFTLTSLDADRCPIRYAIESGPTAHFTIHPVSGELQFTSLGAPFVEGQVVVIENVVPFPYSCCESDLSMVFELAVSAMCKGSAPRSQTPAQVVYIHVGDLPPQFYHDDPYVIAVSEYTPVSASVAQIQTKSFEGQAITYSWKNDSTHDDAFSLNASTGDITLNKAHVYVKDRRQYIFKVTAIEQYSKLKTSISLVINIQPENRHQPKFPASVYSRRDVWENVATTDHLLIVSTSDLDWKENGTVVYTTSNDNFRVDYVDDKITTDGILKADKRLDYDYTPHHVYRFNISATDNAPGREKKKGIVNAEVFVKNINDEAPVFDPKFPTITVKEGAKADLKVYVIQAYDPDGDMLTFRFGPGCTSHVICDIFQLDPDRGIIYLNRDVPKRKPTVELPIIARDDSSCCPGAPDNEIHEAAGTIVIRFVGVNHPPVFEDCRNYDARISEAMPIGSSVLNITATDDDAGSNGELTYSLVASGKGNYFHINRQEPGGAEIITARVFDRESPADGAVTVAKEQKYKLTVTATDNGTPQLSANCFLFVTIDDVNDNAPIFNEGSYSQTIGYNTTLNSSILRVFALDDDDSNTNNAKLKYPIAEDAQNCQGCVGFVSEKVDVGWLVLKKTVADKSICEINLRVKVEDLGSPVQSTTVDVKISFTRNESLPPEWGGNYSLNVSEAKQEGTQLVLSPKIKRPDGVVYYLLGGRTLQENSAGDFYYSGSPGDESMTIRVRTLDYETTLEYWLKLRASKGSLVSDLMLKVELIDANDKAPAFEGLSQDGQYKGVVTVETTRGDYVFSVIAIDLDGTFPYNEVRYFFQPNCGEDCDAFILDSATGVITANKDYYDRSEQSSYVLHVRAEDGANSAATHGQPNKAHAQVIIEVIGSVANSPPPFDKQSEAVQITEGIPRNTTVAEITAIDPGTGYNIVQYGIEDGNDERVFAVDFISGRIYTVGDILYKKKQEYVLTYRVFDGEFMDSIYVNINVQQTNMYPPVFEQQQYENTTVVEHSSVPEKLFLGHVSATDPDIGRPGAIAYSLEGDCVAGHFSIDQDGNVYLDANASLDRDYPEGTSNWQFNVVATNEMGVTAGGQPSRGYAIFNLKLLDINDNAPVFDTATVQGRVLEHSAASTFVMQVVANDWDAEENGTVTYDIIDVPEDTLGRPLFEFDRTPSSTGNILTTNTNAIDREEKDVYYMTIKASDGGDPSRAVEQRLQINIDDINDNAPLFETKSYNLEVSEGLPFGTSVLTVYAKDADIGENAKLTYEILTATDNFYIDSIFAAGSGVIKVKEVIDYDTMVDKTIKLYLRVSDPDFEDFTSVSMKITDINDNAPVFEPPTIATTLREDVNIGASIATFTAADKDEGHNAEFEYFIDYENTDPLQQFKIDSSTGIVTVRKRLDRDVLEHTVHVLAIDKGAPAMTGTATLAVTLDCHG